MKNNTNTANVTNILRKESSVNHYSNKVLQYRAAKFAQNNNYLECSAKQGQTLVANIKCTSADGTSIIESRPHLGLYDSPRENPLRNDKELELGMRRQALNLAKLTNSTCTISERETTFPITFNCSTKINKIQENINRIAEAREAIVGTTLENTSPHITSSTSPISTLGTITIHSIENSTSSSDNIIRNITRALDHNLAKLYNNTFNTSTYIANSTSLNDPLSNFSSWEIYNTPRIGRGVTTASPISSADSSLLNISLWLLGGALTLGLIFLSVTICEHAHRRTKNSSSALDAERLLEGKESKETKAKQRISIFYGPERNFSSNDTLLAKTIDNLEEEERNSATPPPLRKLRSLKIAALIGKPEGKNF